MTTRTEAVRSIGGVRVDVHITAGARGAELPPLVLLHGVGTSALSYEWLLPRVPERDVYRVDFRGHGTSERAPGTYTLEYYCEDAVRVLSEVVKRPAVVAGFSLGGMVAWTLAQRVPELLVGVLLEDPVMFRDPDWATSGMPEFLQWTIDQEISWEQRGLSVDEAAVELAANSAGPGVTMGDILYPDAVVALAKGTILRDRGTMQAAIDGTMPNGVDIAAPLRVPAVIMAASADVSGVSAADEATLARTHPEIAIHRVETGHDIHNSFAGRDLYVRLLREFLDEYAR
ncbi:hypothetical protein GCM10022288_10340 [Gryllotalpicola kribbensis]|uniref:AB hydrolase-1 domain-containing protein n=1 Tax=Gryllotalpicola kribbensis TaxID=993084 RepID=A0ABP8AMV3_9MICO